MAYHRPDAVRILDWCRAAGYLGKVVSACFGAADGGAGRWLAAQVRELLEGDPDTVLGKLRGLREEVAPAADGGVAQAKLEALDNTLGYDDTLPERVATDAPPAAPAPHPRAVNIPDHDN